MFKRLRLWRYIAMRPRWMVVVSGIYFLVLLLMASFSVFWDVFFPETWRRVGLFLGVVAGVAGNLLANVLQQWKDGRSGGHASVSGLSPEIPGPLSRDAPDAARKRYLEGLFRFCQALPLAALGGDEDVEEPLTLEQVYITLDTETEVPRHDTVRQQRTRAEGMAPERDELRRLSALDAARQCACLALLGDPGSGKSTFVRFLVSRQIRANTRLDPALPGFEAGLLPVFMVLRDLAPRLGSLDLAACAEWDRRQRLAEAVCAQAVEDLRRLPAEAFAAGLREALTAGQCLLVLDGLDEVPYDLRQRVREAVAAVLSMYQPQRVIVTCRKRSYTQEARLPGFENHTLAPFDEGKIRAFVQGWYEAQQGLGRVDASDVESKVHDLTQAALSDELDTLPTNPMLLTTMAIIHQRETRLPRERVRLYSLAVDVLLRRWQRVKVGEILTTHPELQTVLADADRLRTLVEKLAYEAHRSRQNGKNVTDLPRDAVRLLLEKPEYLGSIELADAFLEYVDERAGLLVAPGTPPGQPATYSFPHRTFQEYLAGNAVMMQRRDGRVRNCFALACEGDVWTLAVQYGAEELLYNRRALNDVLDLAYGLCPNERPSELPSRRAALWSGMMAVLVGRPRIERDTEGGPAGGVAYLKRLIPCLVELLGSDLSALERADAGCILAELGDPRFRTAEAWFLPRDPLLGFVHIAAGEFTMGSDDPIDSWWLEAKPAHPCAVQSYYLGRYPVTVAQFRVFVEVSGRRPEDPRSLNGVANHPVAYVTWNDALAYCEWLTTCLKGWDETPEPVATLLCQQGWRVTLPSEAEWEYAARGSAGRIYPWGDGEPDATRANVSGAGIDGISTVGCFPGGATPEGIEDLSGNVWEWTRSLVDDYPYPADPSGRARREALQAGRDVARVLRGGAFWCVPQDVRCALRSRYVARNVLHDTGFRVALVAGLP